MTLYLCRFYTSHHLLFTDSCVFKMCNVTIVGTLNKQIIKGKGTIASSVYFVSNSEVVLKKAP